jgi:hypothetical protein
VQHETGLPRLDLLRASTRARRPYLHPGEIYSLEFAGDTCTAGAARCERTDTVDSTLTVSARVRAGNTAVENATVLFDVAAAGGTDVSVTTREATTNADGIATTDIQTGTQQGIADIQAGLPGGSPLTWKLTVESR